MDEETLSTRAKEIFEITLGITSSRPALAPLGKIISQHSQRLDEPMRVAVAGTIKTGKSTLINALLGEKVVPTGAVEATFNVNWFKYGKDKFLKIHFKNKNLSPEQKSFQELETVTLRAKENQDYLLSIAYIEVFYPTEILKEFNLIDTPGLASFYKVDSENTSKFLGLDSEEDANFLNKHAEELTDITRSQTSEADAIVYLFAKNISEFDIDIVSQFQGQVMKQASPINTIGVLNQVDFNWTLGDNSPLEEGKKITKRKINDSPQLHNLFYKICPASGLLAFGAQTLTKEEFAALTQLAHIKIEQLEDMLSSADDFLDEYPKEANIPEYCQRDSLWDKLGQYGIWASCKLIRNNRINKQEALATELLQHSGLGELRELLLSHFGNRALLIKLNSALQHILTECFYQLKTLKRVSNGNPDIKFIRDIASLFEQLKDEEHAFRELRVLQDYYEEKLDFSEKEIDNLLQVTGECGKSIEERLGLSKNSSHTEMLSKANELTTYWNRKANDIMNANSSTIDAARALAHSYERILFYLQKKG